MFTEIVKPFKLFQYLYSWTSNCEESLTLVDGGRWRQDKSPMLISRVEPRLPSVTQLSPVRVLVVLPAVVLTDLTSHISHLVMN